mgnify:CR=1 FL=1
MAGRYGSDPLNNALLILGIALIIVARILGWAWMNVFILALLCLCYFRMFSRNIQARYAENEKFMRWWRPVSNRIRGAQAVSPTVRHTAISSARSAVSACACQRARERL